MRNHEQSYDHECVSRHQACTADTTSRHVNSSTSSAFSLIEVVLAIGVVAFALLGIFSLFSASLKTNNDASAQQEGFEVAETIRACLQNTNFLSRNGLVSLTNIQNQIYQLNSSTNLYLYTSNGALILSNTPASYGLTNGQLYDVKISRSANLLAMTNVFTEALFNNPRNSDWSNWPALPLQIQVFVMQSPSMPLAQVTNKTPVMTIDLIIPR